MVRVVTEIQHKNLSANMEWFVANLVPDLSAVIYNLDEETFPHIMLFLNNANNLIAYVTLEPLPYKKKKRTPASKCQAIVDYPKLCYLPNSTEAERNKISYYYATMMRSAN